MHTLHHTNVMSLLGVCLDVGGGPAVVMPYMDHGSVLNYLKQERKNLVLQDDADSSMVCSGYGCIALLAVIIIKYSPTGLMC